MIKGRLMQLLYFWAFIKFATGVGLQANMKQNWKLVRDILVGEASFTSSQ